MGRARDYTFEIWQGGIMVAAVSGADLNAVRSEAMHYAMIYGQDGDVEIRGADAALWFPPNNRPNRSRRDG